MKLIEKPYVPEINLQTAENTLENLKRQEELGFGRVQELVLPDLHLSDSEIRQLKQAKELGKRFSEIEPPTAYDRRKAHPYDYIWVFNGKALPIFDVNGNPGCYGQTYRSKSFKIRRYSVNDLSAKSYGCDEVDWTKTPPDWAVIAFPKGSCDFNSISIQMHNSVMKMIEAKEELEWVSGIPQFPSTVLELASRARAISPEGQFMLIYQPDWKYSKVELPQLDPILLMWHPLDRGEGVYFKIAQWGDDQELLD